MSFLVAVGQKVSIIEIAVVSFLYINQNKVKGVMSSTDSLSLLHTVPPSPPLLHVTETTASSIRVQWSVEDTGGAPLQGATLHYR